MSERTCPTCNGMGKLETLTYTGAAEFLEGYARGELHMTVTIAAEAARLLRAAHEAETR